MGTRTTSSTSRARAAGRHGRCDTSAGLEIEAIPTPGHSDDMVWLRDRGELVFSGDTLFRDSVGGRRLRARAARGEDVLHDDAHSHRLLPGHTEESTIGREWDENPFVVVWRGARPEGTSG